MNPFLSVSLAKVMGLRRVCPKCKRGIVVPLDKKGDPVRCEFCKTDVPPVKKP
jgi:hypothetical protein